MEKEFQGVQEKLCGDEELNFIGLVQKQTKLGVEELSMLLKHIGRYLK